MGYNPLRDAVRKGLAEGATDSPTIKWLEGLLQLDRDNQNAERVIQRGDDKRHNPVVSDAGKDCPQQTYYLLTNTPETDPPTIDQLLNFKFGSMSEHSITALAELDPDARFIQQARVDIPLEGTKVTGYIDRIILLPNLRRVVEEKTIGGDAMAWMLKKNEHGRREHQMQLLLYLYALNHGHVEIPDDIRGLEWDEGELVYVVKNATRETPNLFSFSVPYDETRALSELLNLQTIAQLAADGREPGIPVQYQAEYDTKGKPPLWPCLYCNFKGRCFA